MTQAGPVTESERIVSLDALRGFALLGILVMNVQSFAMPFSAYFNPTTYGNLTSANFAVWLASHVLFDQKFMTLFSMLFGAGVVLMSARVAQRGDSPARRHYRRMLWLLLFGLLHAYLLWYGDILVLYALCGLLIYPCRKFSPRRLLILGAAVIATGSFISIAGGLSIPSWPEEQLTAFTEQNWEPPPQEILSELTAYRGGYFGQFSHRIPMAFEFHFFVIWVWGIWRAGGLMLAGMALYKWGLLSAERSPGFYAALTAMGSLVGLSLIAYGVHRNFAANWDVRYSMFFGGQWNYWGSLFLSAGYLGAVMLLSKGGIFRGLTHRLEAVGRMAFTNYLLHTIICTTIFYGHGFALFGDVTRVGQVPVVAVIWALQLVISPVWLRHYHMGPFEWAWRSLTYGAPAPFRRATTSN